MSAGAGDADDIEEVAHLAKIVSLAPCSAASTPLEAVAVAVIT